MKDCSAHIETLKSMSYTYKCTHGERGVDSELVMVVGVSKGTSVLQYLFWNSM